MNVTVIFVIREKKALKRKAENDSVLEDEYERDLNDDFANKRERLLLPIKSKGNIIKRTIIEDSKF